MFVPAFQVELLKKTIRRFYGENLKSLKNLSRIVNKHHFNRLRNLIEEPNVASSIVYGGKVDEENMYNSRNNSPVSTIW